MIRILERAMAVRSQLNNELQQNPPDLHENPDCTSMDAQLYVAIKRPIFKQKKVFATLSLQY
jgi:hypothetical protein